MKDNRLLAFLLTAILDVTVGIITLEVLGMIFISSLEIVSIYVIIGTAPIILLTDSLINKLKKNEELK
jgi:hypothetical protein